MSIHNLSLQEKLQYLFAIRTTIQCLFKVQNYSSLENTYKGFKQDWGGVNNDENTDHVALEIIILYYYAKFEFALISMTDEPLLKELTSLKNEIQQNDYFQKFNDNDAVYLEHAIGFTNVDPAVLCKWLMCQYDNKISDLTGGKLLQSMHDAILDNHVFNANQASIDIIKKLWMNYQPK
jgi:hypothetical protein